MDLTIGETQLKCYDDGLVERLHKRTKKWRVCQMTTRKDGYCVIRIEERVYLLHRIIYKAFNPDWDLDSHLQIDHINRDRGANFITNLRLVNNKENAWNRDAKGYFLHSNKYWVGKIVIANGILNKSFRTEEEARVWYLQMKEQYHNL